MICRYCLTDNDEAPVAVWEFVLPLEPPSQNVVAQNKGAHKQRRKYTKYRDDFVMLLRNAKQWHNIPDATGRRRLVITRLFSGRGQSRDKGNLIGGCKPLLDAMTKSNLIVDDAEEWLQDFYRQTPSNSSGVAIRLEELA